MSYLRNALYCAAGLLVIAELTRPPEPSAIAPAIAQEIRTPEWGVDSTPITPFQATAAIHSSGTVIACEKPDDLIAAAKLNSEWNGSESSQDDLIFYMIRHDCVHLESGEGVVIDNKSARNFPWLGRTVRIARARSASDRQCHWTTASTVVAR